MTRKHRLFLTTESTEVALKFVHMNPSVIVEKLLRWIEFVAVWTLEASLYNQIKLMVKLKRSEDQLTIDDLTNAMIDEQGLRGEQFTAVCTTNHLLISVPLHVSFELENVR